MNASRAGSLLFRQLLSYCVPGMLRYFLQLPISSYVSRYAYCLSTFLGFLQAISTVPFESFLNQKHYSSTLCVEKSAMEIRYCNIPTMTRILNLYGKAT